MNDPYKDALEAIKKDDAKAFTAAVKENGIDLTAGFGDNTTRVIHETAYACATNVLRSLLCQRHININERNYNNDTALMIATRTLCHNATAAIIDKHLNYVKVLIEYGADLFQQDSNKRYVVEFAEEVANNHKASTGNTPLAAKNFYEYIRYENNKALRNCYLAALSQDIICRKVDTFSRDEALALLALSPEERQTVVDLVNLQSR